jgi:hypothetical protein
MINEIFDNRWILLKKCGSGSFSQLFVAQNINTQNQEMVAIKVQLSSIDPTVMKSEAEVLRYLCGLSTIPRFIHTDRYLDYF